MLNIIVIIVKLVNVIVIVIVNIIIIFISPTTRPPAEIYTSTPQNSIYTV